MVPITRQRCVNHAHREAAAVCLECGYCFCRECITEHRDRVVCAACLTRLTREEIRRRSRLSAVAHIVLFFCAVTVIWLAFYMFGQALLQLPVSFHDGTVWKNIWPG